MKEARATFTLRMPIELKDQLAKIANSKSRSINGELLEMIKEKIEEYKTLKEAA